MKSIAGGDGAGISCLHGLEGGEGQRGSQIGEMLQ